MAEERRGEGLTTRELRRAALAFGSGMAALSFGFAFDRRQIPAVGFFIFHGMIDIGRSRHTRRSLRRSSALVLGVDLPQRLLVFDGLIHLVGAACWRASIVCQSSHSRLGLRLFPAVRGCGIGNFLIRSLFSFGGPRYSFHLQCTGAPRPFERGKLVMGKRFWRIPLAPGIDLDDPALALDDDDAFFQGFEDGAGVG